MLFIGEEVVPATDRKSTSHSIRLKGRHTAKDFNSLAVIAMAEHDGFLNSPDVYMDKIAVGGGLPEGVVDIDKERGKPQILPRRAWTSRTSSVSWIAAPPRAYQESPRCWRPIMLITDGDVSGIMATSEEASGVDILGGSVGAPEGVWLPPRCAA